MSDPIFDEDAESRDESTYGKAPTVPALVKAGAPEEAPRQKYLGPYRLLEHIGGGGMGIVYRAEDTRLQRIVALKLLPPDLTRDPLAKARFLREARMASALYHPNICSIYEIGETADFQLYIVMPCYEGETLRERIERGPLPISEALDISSQVAQGLAKAHRKGIVHRDIKPANLMITSDGLVKILDFGIAKLVDGAGLTRTGSVVGTPPYMSPEQMSGATVDEKTDLWSLGIVLYEMVTGRRPFRGGHESVLREAILYTAPELLTHRRPEASAELQRLVSGLLTKDPAARTASAEEVVKILRTLNGMGTGSRLSWQLPLRVSRVPRAWRLSTLGFLVLVALAGLLTSTHQESARTPAINLAHPVEGENAPAIFSQSERRPTLIVLAFQNLESAPSARGWVGPALTEMLTAELAAGGTVRVVSGSYATLVRKSLFIPLRENTDRTVLGHLRSIAGADFALVGAYQPLKGGKDSDFRLEVRVVALPEGKTIASIQEDGNESELLDLVERTGEGLRRAIGLSVLTAKQMREVREFLPSDSGAIRLYTEALVAFYFDDSAKARDSLLDAERLDPKSAAIQLALSKMWIWRGDSHRAQEAASKAFQLRESLSREAGLAIEAQLYNAQQQWARASKIYRTLWALYPDDMEYGLQLALALGRDGRGREAMSILAELRKLHSPKGENLQIDYYQALVANEIQDFPAQEKAAAAAATKAWRLGALPIMARALISHGHAVLMSGQAREALPIFRQAESIGLHVEDRWVVRSADIFLVSALRRLGRLAEAIEIKERILAVAGESGLHVDAQASRLGGELSLEQGDGKQAISLYEQAHDRYSRIGDRSMLARIERTMAWVYMNGGELTRAKTLFARALENSLLVASQEEVARSLYGQALLQERHGEPQEALRLCEEALHTLAGVKEPELAFRILGSSTDLLIRTGDLRMAQRRLRLLAATRRKLDTDTSVKDVLSWQARFALATGRLAVSQEAGEAQLKLAPEINNYHLQLHAQLHALWDLAQAAQASGDSAYAIHCLREALRISVERKDDLVTAKTRVDLARIELEQGESDAAEQLARKAADWYGARQIVGGEAAATTALADSLLRLGRQEEAFTAAKRVRTILPKTDRELVLSVAPALARIDTAAGVPGVVRRLREAVAEAEEIGFVLIALDARLTLGQLLVQQGDPAGRETLRTVQKEATARGLGLIARRAGEALTSPPSPSTPPAPPLRGASPGARGDSARPR